MHAHGSRCCPRARPTYIYIGQMAMARVVHPVHSRCMHLLHARCVHPLLRGKSETGQRVDNALECCCKLTMAHQRQASPCVFCCSISTSHMHMHEAQPCSAAAQSSHGMHSRLSTKKMYSGLSHSLPHTVYVCRAIIACQCRHVVRQHGHVEQRLRQQDSQQVAALSKPRC